MKIFLIMLLCRAAYAQSAKPDQTLVIRYKDGTRQTVALQLPSTQIAGVDFEAESGEAGADLTGTWNGGSDWGTISFKKADDRYEGTYTATFGKDIGRLSLRYVSEGKFEGRWWEGSYRSGNLLFQLDARAKAARGTWNADKACEHKPGEPLHAPLSWTR